VQRIPRPQWQTRNHKRRAPTNVMSKIQAEMGCGGENVKVTVIKGKRESLTDQFRKVNGREPIKGDLLFYAIDDASDPRRSLYFYNEQWLPLPR